jgi:outer membrane biosynthesis protein TonB
VILLSAALVGVAILCFVIGVTQTGLNFIYASMAASIASFVTLIIGVVQGRKQLAEEGPATDGPILLASESDFRAPMPGTMVIEDADGSDEDDAKTAVISLRDDEDREPSRPKREVGAAVSSRLSLDDDEEDEADEPGPARRTAAAGGGTRRTTARKPAAKKPAAKKPAAKKSTTAKKPAAKKPAAKKPAAKKPAAKKPAAKKPAAKTTAAKKSTTAKKPAAKKPAAKKTPAKRPTRTTASGSSTRSSEKPSDS